MFAIVRYLYFQRYPILFGVLLVALAPLGIYGFPRRLLANVFLVHNLHQTASLTVACFCLATVLAAQIWIVNQNGKHRFADLAGLPVWFRSSKPLGTFWSWSWLGTLLWLIAALVMPITTVWNSWTTSAETPTFLFPLNVSTTSGIWGLVIGAILSGCLLVVVSVVNVYFGFEAVDDDDLLPLDGFVATFFNRRSTERRLFAPFRGPLSFLARVCSGPREGNETKRNGYAYTRYINADDKKGESVFEPGHLQLAIFVLLLALIVFCYSFSTSEQTFMIDAHWFGSAFFLVVMLTIAANAIASVSFFGDAFRLPPMVLVVIAIGWAYLDFDHTFPVIYNPGTVTVASAPQDEPRKLVRLESKVRLAALPHLDLPTQIYGAPDRKPLQKGEDKYLIVITAPGGGIHAAGWTAQVLTGLHARYGERFSKSIGLISAVSGGSVGVMHYANAFENLNATNGNPAIGKEVVADACGSSLEAVGWGLAYEDLPRLVQLRRFAAEKRDRSMVVEDLWNSLLMRNFQEKQPPTLRTWRERCAQGTCPPLVFNATEVESGRRVLFGNIALPPALKEVEQLGIASRQFFDVFPDKDLEVATAVRLSATFPYVFPAAKHQELRAEEPGESEKPHGFGHVVDGGYIDNEGIITAVEVIKEMLQKSSQSEEARFNKVLLIRIQHHAAKKQSKNQQRAPASLANWQAAFAGPVQAILSVRDSSQVERGAIETDLLMQLKQVDQLPIQSVFVEFVPTDRIADLAEDAIPFNGQLSIAFDDAASRTRSNYQSPLSWKLTPRQFEEYGKCWEAHAQKAKDWGGTSGPRPALALLDEVFGVNE